MGLGVDTPKIWGQLAHGDLLGVVAQGGLLMPSSNALRDPGWPLDDIDKDHTISDSWSPRDPRCPKLTDRETSHYLTAGAPESL